MTLTADLAAAALLVDQVLAGASAKYVWLHRDRLIREHAAWCAFERIERERKAHRGNSAGLLEAAE